MGFFRDVHFENLRQLEDATIKVCQNTKMLIDQRLKDLISHNESVDNRIAIITRDIILSGNSENSYILLMNKNGEVLWESGGKTLLVRKGDNIFSYLDRYTKSLVGAHWLHDINYNMSLEQSGTIKFMVMGQRKFAAYTPLAGGDLYLMCVSQSESLNPQSKKFLALSIILWLMILILPIVVATFMLDQQKRRNKELEKLYFSDKLIGGENVNYFRMHAPEFIQNFQTRYALVITNLCKFNIFMEKCGLKRGNEVIKKLFLDIKKQLNQDEILCRIYADHMIFLLRYEEEIEINKRLVEIGKGLGDTSFKLEFGVYAIRDVNAEIDEVIQKAQMALDNDHKVVEGNVSIAYYDKYFMKKLSFERNMESRIYKAFRQEEFKIFVEPRYNLETRSVCNGDILALWNYPAVGKLRPETYSGVFERCSLSIALDSFIFEEVCQQLRKHLDEGRVPMPLTMKLHVNNMSVLNLINKFKRIRERYGIPGNYLAFEIVEEIALMKSYQMQEFVDFVHEMGATCILGDYTGGGIPMRALCEMDIDAIKFSGAAMSDNCGLRIMDAMVNVGKSIEVFTIATDISTQDQIRHLLQLGCDEAKGDAFATSISLEEYLNIL